jgi:hypothetical protein
MNRHYVFKTVEEAKRVRPEAYAYYKHLKGLTRGYIGCYYSPTQVLEDKEAGYIKGESL